MACAIISTQGSSNAFIYFQFKRILRLPRLFFRQPTEAESVHGGRPLKFQRQFRCIRPAASPLLLCWSLSPPRLAGNSTAAQLVTDPLWRMTRISGPSRGGACNPNRSLSSVILVDGAIWISTYWQKGLGKRPVQLAMAGPGYPVWPISPTIKLFTARLYSQFRAPFVFCRQAHPPHGTREKAVRRSHTQTPGQRASEYLAMPLEEHVAFLSGKTSRSSSF